MAKGSCCPIRLGTMRSIGWIKRLPLTPYNSRDYGTDDSPDFEMQMRNACDAPARCAWIIIC